MGEPAAHLDVANQAPISGPRIATIDDLYSLDDAAILARCGEAARVGAAALHDLCAALHGLERGDTEARLEARATAIDELGDVLTVLHHGLTLAGLEEYWGIQRQICRWLGAPTTTGAHAWARQLEVLAIRITT